ncbi:MAG: LCP family protein [Slackia sp.]
MKKKKSKLPKILITVFAVLFALIVCAGIALALWVNSLNKSMGFEDEAQKQELMRVLAPSNDGQNAQESSAFYMLILGSDAREGDGASRADVTMLCRIDPDTATVDLVSIPRDTMVEIDGYGTQKINAAYSFGGAAGAVETVSQFAGVDISHYAEVHFEELESVVDELGGIWVNVPEAFQAGNISFDAGEQKLNGEQALAFARERHNVSGGDFGRAQAQRIIVQAIIKQVLNTPPAELPSIVGKLASSVSTDYSVTDLVSLAQTFQGKSLVMYSAVCPSYSLSRDGVSYVATMFDEWRAMMQRVDAGLDPSDTEASIPEPQAEDERLGAASNSPAPRHYAGLAENAGLTTDDVAPESAGSN